MAPRGSFQNGSTPTVLLVHGAFADGSSWSGVVAALQADGMDVQAVANPLRGTAADAAHVAVIAAAIDGPVLLVGHSYGGMVVDRAAVLAPNVVGLVYVAAFVLAEGERVSDVTDRFPDSLLGPALWPAPFATADGGPGVELRLQPDRFAEVFAADLPTGLTTVMAASQRPVAAAAFEESSPVVAWRTLPTWFVLSTADRAIQPEAQRFMASRAGAEVTELDASHAVALSQPAAVAAVIRAAALTPRAAQPAAHP
ncbi:alpha/beta fold hydrolase [Modestobacter sp. VKM Ac-2985]|uniref:alpha/beta fold hydrolase n=1 Tax=Modestobacter sp. VKM Ac-2985 TaxID=3004139 RepID=UPI0022AB8187|nr:alpha/beta hydrolase [Modestobacter sp. VKM Ac-2985]MCZ2839617.1 alpha/beta hydrolase [Modestobacter sp. VKM Ac-2985]